MALEVAALSYTTVVALASASKIIPIIAAGATILARHHFNIPQLKFARRYSYAVIASNASVIAIGSYFLKDLVTELEPSAAAIVAIAALATTPVVLAGQHLLYYWGSLVAYHIGKTIVVSMRQ